MADRPRKHQYQERRWDVIKRLLEICLGSIRNLCLILPVMACVVCCLESCDHREFLYELPSKRQPVTVEFDWSNDPGANPEGMTVYFFRLNSTSSTPITYDMKGRDGGSLTLIPGLYAAISHNNDSDRHGYVGSDTYHEFGIKLNDHRSSGDLTGNSNISPRIDNERIAHSPDSMWVGTISMFEVPAPAPTDNSPAAPVVIRFVMQPVVAHYTFHINNPINFNNSMSISATISGMAGTIHPGRGVKGDETVTHFFNMTPTSDGNLFGEFLTFGHCGGDSILSKADDNSHILIIHATLSDGNKWNSVHDVTDQIHKSKVQDCVITLDSVSFPKSSAGGGFSPTVDDWSGNHEEVSM